MDDFGAFGDISVTNPSYNVLGLAQVVAHTNFVKEKTDRGEHAQKLRRHTQLKTKKVATKKAPQKRGQKHHPIMQPTTET